VVSSSVGSAIGSGRGEGEVGGGESSTSPIKEGGGVVSSSVGSAIGSGRGEGEAGGGESWPRLEIARLYTTVSTLTAW